MRKQRSPGLMISVTRHGRAGLLRTTALQAAAVLVIAVPAAAQPAPTARPTGGVVVGGSASIGQTTAQTTVQQNSQRAAIDWRSFDVGSQHTVQYNQPNASAVILNRVTGPDPSQIAGRIQANGQVVITNQSGVVFHKGAQVDAAGLVVSAAGITTSNFMAGRMVFDQAPHPDAAVTNAGTITVKETGLAALVAPRVANSGVINARLGRAVLAGAETHTVDLYGDGLLAIDVTGQVRQAPRGKDGKPVTALVTNTGTVMADGGTVQITAAAADGIVQNLVQAGGTIRANTAAGRPGTVVIAGVGGGITIEGRVQADGPIAGTVLVGTQATPSVTVASGATITANGRRGGSGGQVALISGGTTRMDGRIAARGSRTGGDGGKVEVSGKTLGLTGAIDTAAPKGRQGRILLDPTDVTISDHGGSGTVVTPFALQSMTGDVTVQADNSIVASSSVRLTGSNQSLTLDAGNFIRVDAGVTLDVPGSMTLKAGAGGISLLGNVIPRNAVGLVFNTTGAVTQGPGSVIDASNVHGAVGSAALTSAANRIAAVGYDPFGGGTENGLVASAVNGDIAVSSSVPLTIQGAYYAAGSSVQNGRTITFASDNITIAANDGGRAASAPGGTIALQPLTGTLPIIVNGSGPPDSSPTPLALNAPSLNQLKAPTLSIGTPTGGALTLASDGTTIDFGALGFTTVRLRSGGNIGQTGAVGIINVDAAAFNIDLSGPGNTIRGITQLAATNDALLHTGSALAVNGPVSGAGRVSLSSTANMTLAGNISGGSVNLDTYDGNSLATSGALTQTAGVITGSRLSGQAASATLNGANNIPLGDFSTANNFAFTGQPGISIAGTLSIGNAATFTTAGALTQTATGSLQASSLNGTAGSVTLNGASNLVGSLAGFTTTTGGFALTTQLNDGFGMTVDGTVSVPTGQGISLVTDGVTLRNGALSAPGGFVQIQPLTNGRAIEIINATEAQDINKLSLSQPDLNVITTGILRVGNAAAGPITIGRANDTVNLTNRAGELNLTTAGAITEGAGAVLTVGALSGNAASLALGGANAIGALNSFTTTGILSLTNAATLAVNGPVSAGGALSLTTTGASALTLAGNVSGPSITLNAGTGGIGWTGGLTSTAGTLNLVTTGAVTQTGGSITAATLTGNTTGATTLTAAANAIGTLGAYTAGGNLALTTSSGLTVAGNVSAPNVTLGANSLALASGALAATNTVTLNVTGAITQTSGTLNAAVLSGAAGSANLTGTVATLSNFTTTGALTFGATGSLTLTGTVGGGTALALTARGLTLNGAVSAQNVTLTSNTSLSPPNNGDVTQTGGTLTGGNSVVVTAAGAFTQTGGIINTALLSGSAGGAVNLAGANNVAQLGFTSGGAFTLNNAGNALAIVGALNAGANTVTLTTGALTQTGAGAVTAGTLTGSSTGPAAFSGNNQVATLGAYSSTGGFTLVDGRDLTQAGALTDTASITLAAAGPLTLGGTLNAPSMSLASTGALTQTGGGITTGSLSVTDATATLTQTGNRITALAGVSSTAAFTLANGQSLTVSGPATSGGAMNLSATGDITLSGSVTAPTLGLTATGNVTQPGGIVTTTTLSGTAGGSFLLGSSGNLVTNLGPVTAAAAVGLTDARSLTVTGAIDPPDVTLNVAGDLSIANSIQANTLALNVSGAVTETPAASIIALKLRGTVGSAVLDTRVAVAELADFASAGAFVFKDGQTLSITGPVSATSFTASSAGSMTVAGSITATSVSLTATDQISTFSTPGNITFTGGTLTATSTALSATGTIGQTGGTIATSALGGTSGSTTSLTAAGNQIAGIGPFNSTGGFSLASARNVGVIGNVTDTASASISTTGALNLAATVQAPTVTLNAGGAITESGSGAIVATTLTGTAGSANFNSSGNTLTNLGAFTTTGDFLLNTPSSLSVTGLVQAGTGRTLTITPTAIALRPGGRLSAPGGTVALAPFQAGAPFTLSSFLPAGQANSIAASTLQVGNATSGDITITNPIDVSNVGTFALRSGGNIMQLLGANISAQRLTANGGTVLLDQANSIAALGDSAATGAFTLNSTGNLALTGAVNAGGNIKLSAANITFGGATGGAGSLTTPGQVNLIAANAITENTGSITAASLTGSAGTAQLTGTNRVPVLNGFTMTGPAASFAFNNQGPLTVNGAIVANGAGSSISLNTTGPLTLQAGLNSPAVNLTAASINQTAGVNSIGTVNVTTQGDATLLGTIGVLGNAQVPGTLKLIATPSANLQVAGTVSAGTLDLSGNVNFTGNVSANIIRLNAGTVSQTGGTLNVGTLTGTLTGALSLGGSGTASIRTLDNVTAGSMLQVNAAGQITVSGLNKASFINIRGPGVTLAGGAMIADGIIIEATTGNVVATSSLLIQQAAATTIPGITQTGTLTILPLSGGTSTLTMLVHGGAITLNNLVAGNTGVRLGLDAGTASGTLTAASLAINGQGGGATLFGTVAGQTGPAAATISTINRQDPAYTLNGCTIAAVSCGPTPTPTPTPPPLPAVLTGKPPVVPSVLRPDIVLLESVLRPDLFTADLITLDIVRSPSDPDFALPNISDRDY